MVGAFGVLGSMSKPGVETPGSAPAAPRTADAPSGEPGARPCAPTTDLYGPTSRGTPPSDRTVGRRFWQNQAENPSRADYSPEDFNRMSRGLPPQRYNADKGGIESMDMSHEPIPRREGSTEMVPRWPQEHAQIDPKEDQGIDQRRDASDTTRTLHSVPWKHRDCR
jgi:hypothetical protein